MNEPMGIATELAAKREALAARLSPAARARAFPREYAQPLPTDPVELKLQKELKAARADLLAARENVSRLQGENATLRRIITEFERSGARPVAGRSPTVNNVIRQFVNEYNALSMIDNRPAIDLMELLGPRRSRVVSWPRHVCIYICREICNVSYPVLGRAFGKRDHTTIMHALRVAPERMVQRPDLAMVAGRVRSHFAPMLAEAA